MANYYNEWDAKTAAWLRELIAAGLIPPGEVDERSILEVKAKDLDGFTQCHFFAGIGGWSYALRLANWPDSKPVWTGSCPCQPLSCGGQRKGHADERHLWPAFYRLIAECLPATIFGEQSASKDGREWLCGVRADLEGLGHAFGCAELCAASVKAPHQRPRLFWVSSNTNYRPGFQQVGGQRNEETAIPALHASSGVFWESESKPLPVAHGIPSRVAALRGYGNAIVPQVAAAFIRASATGGIT